ncbi:hypothetical protein P2S50_15585, partial [Escherichia coli]
MAYLVAVTACVSGVAHTYMAAERLEKLCLLEKWGVSIETQGALGTENRLADEGNDSNLLIVFYVQIMPDDFVMQLHR